jgi:hypothetical protein
MQIRYAALIISVLAVAACGSSGAGSATGTPSAVVATATPTPDPSLAAAYPADAPTCHLFNLAQVLPLTGVEQDDFRIDRSEADPGLSALASTWVVDSNLGGSQQTVTADENAITSWCTKLGIGS